MIRYQLEDVDYYCTYCDSAMESTGCTSPYCNGLRCLNDCGRGCDYDELGETIGSCAVAMASVYSEEFGDDWHPRHRARQSRRVRPITTVHLPAGDCS